jgi:hypothetical protein
MTAVDQAITAALAGHQGNGPQAIPAADPTTSPPAHRSDRLVAHEDPPGRCSHSIWDGSRRLVRACAPPTALTRRCSLPSPSAGRHGTGSCRVQPGVPVPVLSYHGQDAPGAARARRPPELIHSRLPAQSRIVSHPRPICALIESGHRVSTRKPPSKAQPVAFGASGSGVLRLTPGSPWIGCERARG